MAHTVLLIDYDPRSIGRIRQLLQGYGARMIVARDGASGLEAYRREKPDLTLIRDLIPQMHGFEVCRAIKGSDGGADHPVVLLFVRQDHSTLVRTDCDAYVRKPLEDDELLGVLDRLLPGGLRRPDTQPVSAVPERCHEPRAHEPDLKHVPDPQSLEGEIDDRIDEVLSAIGVPATAGQLPSRDLYDGNRAGGKDDSRR